MNFWSSFQSYALDILKDTQEGQEALGAIAQEFVKRASQLQDDDAICLDQPAEAGAAPGRWSKAREVAIVTNGNTKASNDSSMRAFVSFLQSEHPGIKCEPHLIPQDQLKQLMAEFVTKVRAKQEGGRRAPACIIAY